MATELGKAYVQIIPSAKGIQKGIEKELGGSGQGIGTSIAGGIKKAIGVAAIGTFIGKSLSEGGKLEQSIGEIGRAHV